MSTLTSTLTLTGLTVDEALAALDEQLPAGAYKPVPGAVGLTDIDPNWMRRVLTRVFGIAGLGWGYTYSPENLTIRYETRNSSKNGEYGVYAVTLTHLVLWYVVLVDGVERHCTIEATGSSENSNPGYALKGALSNALGNAASNLGFQQSVYLGLRDHESVRRSPAPAAELPDPELPAAELPDPGQFKLPFGKHSGRTLAELWQSKEGQGYVRWLASTDGKGFQPRNSNDQHAQRMARAFLTLQSAYAG